MKGKTFEPVDVLRRIEGVWLVRYRCFRILPDNRYWVHSADRYSLPLSEEQKLEVAKHSLRVIDATPFGAGDEVEEIFDNTFCTLDEAIMAFEGNYSR